MAQNLVNCQFCEISNIIQWKCLNCDLILCEECKISIHTKSKAALHHIIKNYKELGTTETADLIRKLDLKNISCSNHREEKCSLYCKDCTKPACSFCVLESDHETHNFEKLETFYDVQLKKLKDRKDAVERNMPCLSEKAETISRLLSDGNISYDKVRQNILKRESELKQRLKELLKKLDELWVPQKENLLTDEQKIKQRQQNLKQMEADVDQALHSHEAMSILNIIHPTHEDIAVDSMSKLHGGKVSVIEPLCFGVNMNMLLMLKTTNIINIIANYEVNECEISTLKSFTDGRNFLFNTKTFTLKYFGFQHQKCTIKNKVELKMRDVTITKNNEIYFVGFDSPEISTLNESNKINTIMIIKDKKLTSIHATKENTLMVGYCTPKLDKTGNNQSDEGSGIIELDMKGNVLMTFQHDKNHHKIFDYPLKVTTNINGDICVIDKENFSCKVIVLGSLGQLQWQYNGHEIINLRQFSPTDIVTTRSGMVVVTDSHTNTIHMLSINGKFLTFFDQDEGICRPRCLNIDNEGLLQIGTAGENKEKAKIYIVKILE